MNTSKIEVLLAALFDAVGEIKEKLEETNQRLDEISKQLQMLEKNASPITAWWQEPGIGGDKYQASELMDCHWQTLRQIRQENQSSGEWIEEVHYRRRGKRYEYHGYMIKNWKDNQYQPCTHQDEIDRWVRSLPHNKKRRKG